MSAYVISRAADGSVVWWESWHTLGLPKLRDPTPEEERLMHRIVWDQATPADRSRLKECLQ